MKVPKGLTLFDGAKVYKEGSDAPAKFDAVIEKKNKAGEKTPAKEDGKGGKK